MPAATALSDMGKRGPGHFFFFFFAAEYSGTKNRTRVVVNRAGTRAFDYPSQPQCMWSGLHVKIDLCLGHFGVFTDVYQSDNYLCLGTDL